MFLLDWRIQTSSFPPMVMTSWPSIVNNKFEKSEMMRTLKSEDAGTIMGRMARLWGQIGFKRKILASVGVMMGPPAERE